MVTWSSQMETLYIHDTLVAQVICPVGITPSREGGETYYRVDIPEQEIKRLLKFNTVYWGVVGSK